MEGSKVVQKWGFNLQCMYNAKHGPVFVSQQKIDGNLTCSSYMSYKKFDVV